MSGVLERLGRRSVPLAERLEALAEAARLSRGRLDHTLVESAESVVRRSQGRLQLSADHTVVALAGATGSGKSSTFNALIGEDVAEVGVRRPTTAAATGASWGTEAADVLDWLGVPRRHVVATGGSPTGRWDGLVLLDLPDHDSIELAHHLEVDRLVGLVDLFVWVVDPQKYADAALHERYLRPMATHAAVMVVVLNHLDEVAPPQRAAVLDDLRRLLAEDGLDRVQVVAVSARTGEGMDELSAVLAARIAGKRAAVDRLSADVRAHAEALARECGDGEPGRVSGAALAELEDALADAAGIPTLTDAVRRSVARRGSSHTGWPVTSWLARLRPDPLRRLHLDLGPAGAELTAAARTSLPPATAVQRARVESAVRQWCDQQAADLSSGWAEAVRRASLDRREDLEDALDAAVAGTDLGVTRVPLWWRGARAVQLVLAAALLVGALWLVGYLVAGTLALALPDPPIRYGLPVPTLLLLAGAAGGVALAALTRVLNGWTARFRARSASRRLRAAVARVAAERVVAPVEAELASYRRVCEALRVAHG